MHAGALAPAAPRCRVRRTTARRARGLGGAQDAQDAQDACIPSTRCLLSEACRLGWLPSSVVGRSGAARSGAAKQAVALSVTWRRGAAQRAGREGGKTSGGRVGALPALPAWRRSPRDVAAGPLLLLLFLILFVLFSSRCRSLGLFCPFLRFSSSTWRAPRGYITRELSASHAHFHKETKETRGETSFCRSDNNGNVQNNVGFTRSTETTYCISGVCYRGALLSIKMGKGGRKGRVRRGEITLLPVPCRAWRGTARYGGAGSSAAMTFACARSR